MFSLGTPSSLAFLNAVANWRFEFGSVEPPAEGQSELKKPSEARSISRTPCGQQYLLESRIEKG